MHLYPYDGLTTGTCDSVTVLRQVETTSLAFRIPFYLSMTTVPSIPSSVLEYLYTLPWLSQKVCSPIIGQNLKSSPWPSMVIPMFLQLADSNPMSSRSIRSPSFLSPLKAPPISHSINSTTPWYHRLAQSDDHITTGSERGAGPFFLSLKCKPPGPG